MNGDGWLICNAFCGACVRSQDLVCRSCIEDFELNEARLNDQALISGEELCITMRLQWGLSQVHKCKYLAIRMRVARPNEC